jgi:hypothetical protein
LTLDFKLENLIRDDWGKEQRPKTFPVRIPIILPYDGQLLRETVHVRHPRRLQLIHTEEETGWKKKETQGTPLSESPSESVYQTEQAESLLLLGAALKTPELSGTATVEKGWIRRWLQNSSCIDHACYRISTNLSQLTITLPEHVRSDRTTVKVDHQRVVIPRNEQNPRELRIPFPPLSNETVPSATIPSSPLWMDFPERETFRTLEIQYEIPVLTSLNHLTLDMPVFPPEVTVRPVYCQVILPNMRHLLSCNVEWMPQYRWQWDGRFMSRKSDLSQQELEDWIGILHSDPISPAWNSYLFLAFHPESDLQLDLVDRSTLILVSSGLILLFGLIMIYFPRLRYPGVLFTFLVLFVSAFTYRVTMGILFLQAGVIGFVLVLIASFLYRMFVYGDPWWGTVSGSLSTPGRKEHTNPLGRLVVSTDEGHSDPARVRVLPNGHAESDSPVSSNEHLLSETGVPEVSLRKNDDPVHQDETDATSHPISEKERGEP